MISSGTRLPLFCFIVFFVVLLHASAQQEQRFAFPTAYQTAEYTEPIQVYNSIASAVSAGDAKAVKLSANALVLSELEKCTSIQYIFLDNTITLNSYYIDQKGIENLFHTLETLKNLQYIGLEDPRLTPYLATLKYLKGVKLKGFDEVSFSKALPAFNSLEVLIIQDPALMVLPPVIAELPALKQLEIDCINLISLPVNIGQLKNLMVFTMVTGKIRELPPSFANLSQLKYLSCKGANAYKVFPLEITQLSALETLIFELKMIFYIPEEIGQLRNIRILEFLEARKIARLPRSLPNLTKLESIYISDAMDMGGNVGALLFIKQPFTLILNRCQYTYIADELKGNPYLVCLVMPSSALPADIKKVTEKLGSAKVCLKDF